MAEAHFSMDKDGVILPNIEEITSHEEVELQRREMLGQMEPEFRLHNRVTGQDQVLSEEQAKRFMQQFPAGRMYQVRARQSGSSNYSWNASSSNSNGVSPRSPIATTYNGSHPISAWQQLVSDSFQETRIGMIGLDYETYCELDLTKVGLDRYVNHPSFRVLLASVAREDSSTVTLDFVHDYDAARDRLADILMVSPTVVAHNAGFERAVTRRLKINASNSSFIDSAVIARCLGAASGLAHAAPQLLGEKKMEEGRSLIKKFSQAEHYPTWDEVKNDPDWEIFKNYCDRDAALGLRFALQYLGSNSPTRDYLGQEMFNEVLTQNMNDIGWHVDLKAVKTMQVIYEENKERALQWFREHHDPEGELNFNSPIQLVRWCKDRGVNARSFDEAHVESMLKRVDAKIEAMYDTDPKWNAYHEVKDLLETKKILGGSSLKKLKVILETTGPDGRLRNQYMHAGAGQSYRTSGRGVQMQNLKRLSTPRNMEELYDLQAEWTNDDLAENLRQVFTATNPKGSIIVGDFSSVEARGLAYLAGQEDTLQAFRDGKDLYKVQAASIFHVPYEEVTKDQRRTGKVGVLACGYQAGSGAVSAFAKGMGVDMSEEDAAQLVKDWRRTNDKVVWLWDVLDGLLLTAVAGDPAQARIGNGLEVEVIPIKTPASLNAQHPGAQSIELRLISSGGKLLLSRVFHGCYKRGRSICYYKPDAKNGQLWSGQFRNQKTKQMQFHSIYGGKLTGILTQSMCRELFFWVMQQVSSWVNNTPGIELIGQFHDELVFDYDPDVCKLPLERCIRKITVFMSVPKPLHGFPLEAEVKADYRYTK